jgi:ketosteroid isomerase-like protein
MPDARTILMELHVIRIRILINVLLIAAVPALADAVDDVRCNEIQFSKSVETQDAELFVTFIDDDARFVSGVVSHGPAAVASAWSTFFADDGPRIKWRPQYVEVLEDGTLALSRGPYRMIVTDETGAVREIWGTFNSVWRLQDDGSWKVVFDAGSAASAAPSIEVQALLDQDDTCSDRGS